MSEPRGASAGRCSSVSALGVFVVGGALIALAELAHTRFLLYAIEGESMASALRPGDFVVVDIRRRRRPPRPGQVVLARDPRDASRTIVKRVVRTDLHGGAWLLGDNADWSTDSRVFGAVPASAIVGRVRWRYWPLSRLSGVV